MISLTHAVNGSAVDIASNLIAAVYTMRMEKIAQVPVTVVLFSGGAMLPVKESQEEVKQKLNEGEGKDVGTN